MANVATHLFARESNLFGDGIGTLLCRGNRACRLAPVTLDGIGKFNPANRLGSSVTGGPFNMWQLKLIQEVISISIFVAFTLVFFKTDALKWNHIIGFLLLLGAVYFFFRK